VASIDAFSGHADKNELRRYVEAMSGPMHKIFVVHGEESQCLAFAGALRSFKPQSEVLVPEPGQAVSI